jgi:2-oxoglutarate dehydrogenase E2 component (dihydrolipoamide succinyltransferase)
MIEIKVPSPGESITEVEIASWLVADGDFVEKNQPIAEIDSDKATLELVAEADGKISLKSPEGTRVDVGQVVATLDTSVKGAPKKSQEAPKPTPAESKPQAAASPSPKKQAEVAVPEKATPLAKEILKQSGVAGVKVQGTGPGGKITRHDVEVYIAGGIDNTGILSGWGGSREERRERMSTLRRKVAERLVSVKQETAMLTTFNEVDMSAIYAIRDKYKDAFKEKHGSGLGFMSFFTKACTEALRMFPAVNGQIDGDDIVLFDYADIGIAVSSPKGLMVPVLRNAEQMSLAQIEAEIKRLAIKARDGKLSIEEMTGGTFTITNGGVFGSMLSTPIINPPQSAILGMHNVVDRPVAINGKVEIRPIMYVALSYDHRIIDGKESVSFLFKVKEYLENPVKLMFGNKTPEEVLLGL